MAVVILKRSESIPKAVWRGGLTRRTLAPLPSGLNFALEMWTPDAGPATLIECEIAEDGMEVKTRVVRTLQNDDSAGVFDLSLSGGQVKLRLSQEGCRREVHTPRRSSRFLTALTAWEPIRVILNGKAGWSSGRYYYLQDYHVMVCQPPRPTVPLPLRTFDFQADLV